MHPPKITFMTTLQVNVGDEFIREGIRSILDEILPGYDPFFVNKVNLATLSEPVEEELYRLQDKFRDADIIIQAGAPVYWNLGSSKCYNVEWAEELWFKRIFVLGREKVILNLGAGSCQAIGDSAHIVTDDPGCRDFAERVASACALTTVRDPFTSEVLTHLDIPHFSLPCPAFHAARRSGAVGSLSTLGTVGINLMPLGGHYKLSPEIDPVRWEAVAGELVRRLRSRHRLLFIAHDSAEQKFLERFREGSERIFGPRPFRDYLLTYAACSVVLANRVHGAVCAAGFGCPAVIVGNDSRMYIGQYINLPLFSVQKVQVDELESTVEDLLKDARVEQERLLDLRESSAKRYRELVSPLLLDWQKHATSISPLGAVPKKRKHISGVIEKILIPRFDTIGDIILLEGFIEALIEKFPKAEITLLVREGYEQLAPLFPRKLIWMTTALNPYRDLNEDQFEDLSEFLKRMSKNFWDLLLTTTYSRTWLDDVLAAKLGGVTRIALGEKKEIGGWLERLFAKLHLETEENYDEVIPVEEGLRETEKYQQFWSKLFEDEKRIALPRIVIAEDIEEKAEAILSKLGLNGKEFFICLPAGTHNVPIKVWPIERFGEVISWINKENKFEVLIVGHESEDEVVNKLTEVLRGKGIEPFVWLGRNGELPVLAAIMEKGHFYLGNDAGPMHIAAAASIPVVGIFGGGTWPRFVPFGLNSIAIAGELPCFGCNWECIFDDAPCMRLVDVEDVKKAMRIILGGKAVESNVLRSSKKITSEGAELIERAVKTFRNLKCSLRDKLEETEADRTARLEVIHDCERRIQNIEEDRQERLGVIEDLGRRLEASEADRGERLGVIEDLGRRLEASEADRGARLRVIEDLEGKIEIQRTERDALREIIERMESSLSWKMTRPLRWLFRKFDY